MGTWHWLCKKHYIKHLMLGIINIETDGRGDAIIEKGEECTCDIPGCNNKPYMEIYPNLTRNIGEIKEWLKKEK